MNIWLISDTHFGHTILQKYSGRQVNADELILKKIRVVDYKDLLIHLGDVCIGNDDKWHRKLRSETSATMMLVRGNHDKKSISWYLNRGWNSVVDSFILDMYGYRIAFSHCPLQDNGTFDINIHGHLHNTSRHKYDGILSHKHYLIKMEHEYQPVSLKGVIKRWGAKK